MSRAQFELGSLIVAVLTALAMFAGVTTYVSGVGNEAKAATKQNADLASEFHEFRREFSDFKDVMIDKVARVQEDTKAIRHKH